MLRATSLTVMVVALALVGGGCKRKIAPTTQNLAGSWQAPFADQVLTITLNADGTFMIETSSTGTQGTQMFVTSAWSKLPWGGTWRLADGEIVFGGGEGGTAGGLEIGALYEDSVLFIADDGSKMFFDKVATRAGGFAPPAGAGGEGEDEGEDEAEEGAGDAGDDEGMDG